MLVDAPLEEPAAPTRTPNPSKAPWYFLGLQEILVYFDPWHAGVVLPTFIIMGLMVLPYIDTNPKGNGYYTFVERKYEILTFFLGFHILWISLIVVGTFLRGPGWNWFWPWQPWDTHKVVAMTNVDLPFILGLQRILGAGGLRVVFDHRVLRCRIHRHVCMDPPQEGSCVHGAVGWRSIRYHRLSVPEHGGGCRKDGASARA